MAAHFLSPLLASPDQPRRLVNLTQQVVLASRIEAAFDSASRNRGLLGRDSLAEDSALVLAPCNAIHMFGMRFPIDVLFLDRSGAVIKRVTALPANRIAIAWRAFATIEFCANHPGVARTEPGHRLAVE